MSWRKKIRANSLEELHAKAAARFEPGTTYAIYAIKDSGVTGTRIHYLAESLPPGAQGSHRTPDTPVIGREPHEDARGPQGGTQPLPERAPVWKPVAIPPTVLRSTPDRSRTVHLLTDRDEMVPGLNDPMEPGDIMELLNNAAPPEALLDNSAPPEDFTSTGAEIVYAGLVGDAVLAAESDGHLSWEGAGALSGGEPGAPAICYGLGNGLNITHAAEGLHAYDGLKLVLAVDPSRKHEDTVAWVSQILQITVPSAVVPVATVYTATPQTVNVLRNLF